MNVQVWMAINMHIKVILNTVLPEDEASLVIFVFIITLSDFPLPNHELSLLKIIWSSEKFNFLVVFVMDDHLIRLYIFRTDHRIALLSFFFFFFTTSKD